MNTMDVYGIVATSLLIGVVLTFIFSTLYDKFVPSKTERLDRKTKELFGDDYLPDFIKATDEQIGLNNNERAVDGVIVFKPEGTE